MQTAQKNSVFGCQKVGYGAPERAVCIRNVSDYSPFGVSLDGRTIEGDGYRYGYQGSERDDEAKGRGNSYTTFYRQLDPRVGRWFSVDPLFSKYPAQSPYLSYLNNPVIFSDNNGDSIALCGNIFERITLLVTLQKLTNDKLILKNGRVYISSYGTMNSNKQLKTGTKLISEMISNKNFVKIAVNLDKRNMNYGLSGYPGEPETNGVGMGSNIIVDLNHPSYLSVENRQTGLLEEGYTPSHISLGHELIHAFYKMIGKSIPDNITDSYSFKDKDSVVKTTTEEKEETDTVGLTGKREFTENKLRKEQGYRKRVKY